MARSHDDRGDTAAETAALQSAITEAELADEPTMLARAWSELATNVAHDGGRERALFYLERAKRLDRQARLTPGVRAMLLEDEANIEQASSRFAESAVLLEQAVELLESEGDLRLNHVDALTELSEALEFAGSLTDAVEIGERALARLEALVGADHPFTAVQRGRVGRMYGFLEQESRVEAELQRALVVLEANPTFRPDLRAIFYDDLAQSQSNLGKHDAALATVDRLLGTLRSTHGESSPRLAAALMTRGKVLRARGEPEPALVAVDEGLAMARTDPIAGDDMSIGELQLMRAEILIELGEPRSADARAAVDEAQQRLAKVYALGTAFDLQTTERVAAVRGRVGEVAAAQRMLEAGIVRAEAAGAGSYVGRMHSELARIHARGSRPAKAREHLAAARVAHVAFGSPPSYLAEIDAMDRDLPR
jgi:tetratricopeptide (TPR) repeat protein